MATEFIQAADLTPTGLLATTASGATALDLARANWGSDDGSTHNAAAPTAAAAAAAVMQLLEQVLGSQLPPDSGAALAAQPLGLQLPAAPSTPDPGLPGDLLRPASASPSLLMGRSSSGGALPPGCAFLPAALAEGLAARALSDEAVSPSGSAGDGGSSAISSASSSGGGPLGVATAAAAAEKLGVGDPVVDLGRHGSADSVVSGFGLHRHPQPAAYLPPQAQALLPPPSPGRPGLAPRCSSGLQPMSSWRAAGGQLPASCSPGGSGLLMARYQQGAAAAALPAAAAAAAVGAPAAGTSPVAAVPLGPVVDQAGSPVQADCTVSIGPVQAGACSGADGPGCDAEATAGAALDAAAVAAVGPAAGVAVVAGADGSGGSRRLQLQHSESRESLEDIEVGGIIRQFPPGVASTSRTLCCRLLRR